ncbi:MAG: type II toxin-antitoxin system HicA family toxin [Coriobacteriales bacterium]|nr:type II toxin-antitoxin system HicA family toxin [Coriobacteriales bacterium]
MTKQRMLIKELIDAGFKYIKTNGGHDKYRKDKITIAIPHHREISDQMADIIRKEAGLK